MQSDYVYGYNRDTGNFSRCRAKEENRGKGNCPHDASIDHESFSSRQGAQELAELAEKVLQKEYSVIPNDNDNLIEDGKRTKPQKYTDAMKRSDVMQTHPEGRVLTREEFQESVTSLADAYPQEAWDVVDNFYDKLARRVSADIKEKNHEAAIKSTVEFLESDDENAKKIRDFLGKDINRRDFAEILIKKTTAMVAAPRFTNGHSCPPVSRLIGANVRHDMTKKRYVASVLFFGGRCCYCNLPLTKNVKSDQQATGEHITPINPERKSDVLGGTRFGNMALACRRCNSSRGNKNLHEWIQRTGCIPEEQKADTLARIKAFREFAVYDDYTKEQSDAIRRESAKLDKIMKEGRREENGRWVKKDAVKIKRTLSSSISKLNAMIANTS